MTSNFGIPGAGFMVLIEDMLRVANSNLTGLEEDAESVRSKLEGMTGTDSAFSTYPLAQELARHHEKAVRVLEETVVGLTADLKNFQDIISASSKSYTDVDQASSAALTQIGHKYGAGSDHHWNINEHYNKKNNQDNGASGIDDATTSIDHADSSMG